jgi:hypothetical protein
MTQVASGLFVVGVEHIPARMRSEFPISTAVDLSESHFISRTIMSHRQNHVPVPVNNEKAAEWSTSPLLQNLSELQKVRYVVVVGGRKELQDCHTRHD